MSLTDQTIRDGASAEAVRARGVLQRRVSPVDGDCFRASVATLLGLSYEDVPDIRYHGVTAPVPGVDRGPVEDEHASVWWSQWMDWFRERNMALMQVRADVNGRVWCPPGTASLGLVVSPRGCAHSVVCVDDVVAWDPSPHQDSYDLLLLSLTFLIVLDPARRLAPYQDQQEGVSNVDM